MVDTFGRFMKDAIEGEDADYFIERDDGFIRHTSGRHYIAPYEEWRDSEKLAALEIEDPVLDVGCGVGRVGDYVKEKGMEYYGIDLSPLAVEMCHKRGHENVYLMSADKIELHRKDFKTVILFGNNFGIMGESKDVVRMLEGFHEITCEEAKVLAASRDPEATDNEIHFKYHAKNRAEGKPIGLVKLRNRYKGEVDDWWYILLSNRDEMTEIADKAGWFLERTIGEPEYYVGVLRKKAKR
ncbi:MAG: methyltransferase domain-containing protein [Candidatus Thorarchaeota archaeon SMTZ1-45]